MKITPETLSTFPKIRDIVVSPDSTRLALVVETLDGPRFTNSLWEVPADGSALPRQVDLSGVEPASLAYLADGSLVFVSRSIDGGSEREPDAMDVCLLRTGEEKVRSVLTIPGGIGAMAVGAPSGTVVIRAWMFPGAADLAEDAAIGNRRGDELASSILFEELETRHEGKLLGPRLPRLLSFNVSTPDVVTDLTPDAGSALVASGQAISPDGSAVVTVWRAVAPHAFRAETLRLIDATGQRVIATDGQFTLPAISPDGRWAVTEKLNVGSPERAERMSLWIVDLTSGEGFDLTGDFPLWPEVPFFAPDSKSVYFVADDHGHSPIFRVDIATRSIERIADGAYVAACASPDGHYLYGVRHSYSDVPRLVRVDVSDSGEHGIQNLPGFAEDVELNGTASEITCRTKDDFEIHSHLVMPAGASADNPVPLMLWMHGGTRAWNSHDFWLRCPYILVEQGYAVLMVNPGRSNGYGQALMQRGWADWGAHIPDDLLAAVDEAVKRPDIDGDKLCAMGHSFGGHMANWLAGRSDRFKAIIDSAGTWSWELMQGVTPKPTMWEEEFGDPYENPQAWARNSPRQDLATVRTPMLIIYGLKDFDVPISQALQLWTDLKRNDIPAKFLLLPDENHSLSLKPSDVTVYHQTVLAFLDHYVLGEPWVRPALLG
jgi:dipeptidyl aminopeptidase/acylaminoacyl peptidase